MNCSVQVTVLSFFLLKTVCILRSHKVCNLRKPGQGRQGVCGHVRGYMLGEREGERSQKWTAGQPLKEGEGKLSLCFEITDSN